MKEPKEVAFSFEEINLTDAENVVAAGDGRYADLLIMLAKKLPEIEESNKTLDISQKKGFAFGLPGGKEIEESDRRSLCHTVNLHLRRSSVYWRIHYSGNRKLFICVPASGPSKISSLPRRPYGPRKNPRPYPFADEMTALREQKLTYAEIAKKIGLSESQVGYFLGKKPISDTARHVAAPVMKTPRSESPLSVNALISLARVVLNYTGPLGKTGTSRRFRTAVSAVAHNDLGISYIEIDAAVGTKKGACSFLIKNAAHKAKKEIALLREALHQKTKGDHQ